MMHKSLLILLLAMLLTACGGESFDERCSRETAEFTKTQCPRRIDEATRIDSMVYEPETKTIYYYYTVNGELDDEERFTSEMRDVFREGLLQSITGSIELKAYKEHNVNFGYRYYSVTDGKLLMEETLTPADYK